VWIHPVRLDSALERDLGLDSLSRVELAVRIECAFGATLPETALAEIVTLGDLLAALQEAPGIAAAAAPAAMPAHWSAHGSEPAQAFPLGAATLVESLEWHVRAHPDRVHIVCVGDGVETPISYGELHRQAALVAAGLQRHGLEPRQTVAIMLPTSPEYFHTYFGILLAGGIPVPIYPPPRACRRSRSMFADMRASCPTPRPQSSSP
jgi:acyl carrier protein